MHSDLIKEALDNAAQLSIFKGSKLTFKLAVVGLRYYATIRDEDDRKLTESSVISVNEALHLLINKIERFKESEEVK